MRILGNDYKIKLNWDGDMKKTSNEGKLVLLTIKTLSSCSN